MLSATTSPSRTGTAFPMSLPIVLNFGAVPDGRNLYEGGNVCRIAASLSVIARSCFGWPNRPFPYPKHCVVIVGDGAFHSMRPYTLGYVAPVFLRWHLHNRDRSQSRHVPPGFDARIRRKFNSLSRHARCRLSLGSDSPAASFGRWPIASRTVGVPCSSMSGGSRVMVPRREASNTKRFLVWGMQYWAHSMIPCQT